MNPVYKCCDWGSQLANVYTNSCIKSSQPWYLHINGHRYSEKELRDGGLLKYERKKVGTRDMYVYLRKLIVIFLGFHQKQSNTGGVHPEA